MTIPTNPAPEETEDEKRMRQMIASMRGGIIPSLSENASEEEACVLSEETMERKEHGAEMLANIAKMREAQHGKEAFRALLQGEERKVDLDELVSVFGEGAVSLDAIYCTHCAKKIWHDEDDHVWRHADGELVECAYGSLLKAEPVEDEPEEE